MTGSLDVEAYIEDLRRQAAAARTVGNVGAYEAILDELDRVTNAFETREA